MLTELKFLLTVELYVLKKHTKEKAKQRWYYKFLPESACEAFTLAEVLMTLLIIGIVASIVIPALINDTQNAELNTALKKVYAELSVATKQIIYDNGGTFVGLRENDNNGSWLTNVYSEHLNYTKLCINGTTARFEGCWHQLNAAGGAWLNMGKTSTNTNSISSGLILSNGTLVNFIPMSKNCTYSSGYYTKPIVCGWVIVDVNGFKGPNITGMDIFYFNILPNKLEPWGSADSPVHTCSAASLGLYCTASKLVQ